MTVTEAPRPAPATESDSVARNTAFGLATQLTSAAFTAVTTLYLVRALGPDSYGVFALAVGIGALLVLVSDFGLTPSAERFIAERSGDTVAVRTVLADATRLKLAGGALVCGALFALAGPIANAYGVDALAWPLRAVAVAVLGQTMLFLYRGTFVALGRVSLAWRVLALESAVEAGATIALVITAGGAAAAAWGRAAGYVFGAVVGVTVAARLLGRGAAAQHALPRRRLAGYASALFLINATYVLFEQLDVLLIGAIKDATAVGLFEAPLRLVIFLSYAGQAVAFGVAPRLAGRSGGGPDVRAFESAVRWLLLIQAALLAPVLVWAEPITHLALGDGYGESAKVLRALAPFVFLSATGTFITLAVNYLGEAGRRVPLVLGAVGVNLVLDLILIPEIGILGGAVGTDVAFSLYVLGHLWICARLLHFQVAPLITTLVRALAAAGAACAVLAAFGTADLSAGDAVAGAVLGGSAYVGILVATGALSRRDLEILLPGRR
jgi:O-antigen/teichoic acid export membrane protein